jgi:cell division inhibitor SepF
MGLFNKFRRYDEDEYEDEMVDTAAKDTASVSLGGSNIELKVIRPSSFEQLLKAVDHLSDGKTILLNLEGTDTALVRRMIDFISGSAYAMRLTIKKATDNSYCIAPNEVDVSGAAFENTNDDEDEFFDI